MELADAVYFRITDIKFLAVCRIYDNDKTYCSKCNCQNKELNMQNFEFEYKGKKYWYSRSVTGVAYIFCRDRETSEWCVLADKRGPGCPTNVGKWNVPCGYLDHNESVVECAKRELHEETGVDVDVNKLKFYRLRTTPYGKKQNVDCSFFCILSGYTDEYKTTDQFSEPSEVDCIKWIPISTVCNYEFAFNQTPIIMDIYNRFVNISFVARIMLKVKNWIEKRYCNQILA